MYHEEYDEPEDHDGEWIDMSGIPEDATFEELELACMLESSRRAKRDQAKVSAEAIKAGARGESRDVLKAGKGGRPENYKQVRLKLQSDRLTASSWNEQRTWSFTVDSGG